MIDKDDDRALYHQVADELRAEIEDGQTHPPGSRLPSRKQLAKRFGCGVDSVRAAMRVLEQEALVIVLPREGTKVRGDDPQSVVYVSGPVRITARMPGEPERREKGWPPGTPVISVERPPADGDGAPRIVDYPGHTTTIEIGR